MSRKTIRIKKVSGKPIRIDNNYWKAHNNRKNMSKTAHFEKIFKKGVKFKKI